MYTATTANTAFAEVFQESRMIDRDADGPVIAAWQPSRELQLLDLTSTWPVQNGASASMMMDDKANTQAWAQAIFAQFGGDIDGLYHQSSITNEPMVTLFLRVKVLDAFPKRPRLWVSLADDQANWLVEDAVDYLKSYDVVRV